MKVGDLGALFLNFILEIELKSLRKVHTFTSVAVESETPSFAACSFYREALKKDEKPYELT